ncbi:histidine phosphatase superfamily [Mucor mucedo]|uniref:histidine phosphatase superfamily n=1 Tax=Mucor mucedo TaxID=29922 RepID=UPI00222006B6|nr:histidine phosphatase superfamily [Mucor mucedo]KAI7893638.1 histidine phosphatase superfamily [Mucor mucedo]
MSFTVTLVRHGNTDANNERWLQGQIDTDLNKNGREQAKRCGKRLKDDPFSKVYCSDLNRCKQTAAAIMAHHPGLSIAYDEQLRERDFGKLSGKPLKYLTSESTRQHLSVDEFITQEGGESVEVFRRRIITAYEKLIAEAQEQQLSSILVVTHGGPLKYLTSYWIENEYKLDPLIVKPMAHGNTAITKIHNQMIIQFNSTDHLLNQNQPPPPAV